MAALVCLRRKKQSLGTDEYYIMEVVDGQQRLTTLITLLNIIKLKLDKKQRAEAKMREELAELLVLQRYECSRIPKEPCKINSAV